MTTLDYASQLENAADRIGEISRADLQIMLRRAALRLRNTSQVPLDPAWEDALCSIAAELKIGRNDLIRAIVKEWLETNAYLPVRILGDDTQDRAT